MHSLSHLQKAALYLQLSLGLLAAQPLLCTAILAQDFDRESMAKELLRLEKICRSIGLEEEAEISRTWLPPLRSDQNILFLPAELFIAKEKGTTHEKWTGYINTARVKYAATLFAQARNLAATGDEATAFRLLWQVLHEDPSHTEAKRILGTLATTAAIRPRPRKGTSSQTDFGWPAGSYSRVQTPHFLLTTRAGTEESLTLATSMEEFYALWRQMFYPLWAPPGVLKKRFEGQNTPWEKSSEFAVTLLRDRNDYLEVLQLAEKNAAVSVGYYAPQLKKSFFYPEENLQATFFHELTHQLLAEATNIQANLDAGKQGGVWLIEGIAMYMESLVNRGNYWTVGGIDASRLQTARYRALRDGFWIDWKIFTEGQTEAWKEDPQIARLYTHAIGLTHLFMDHLPNPNARETLFRAIVSTYQNEPRFNEMFDLLGGNNAAAHLAYQDGLRLNDLDVEALCTTEQACPSLVLAASELARETWQRLAALAPQLEWLDLSFSNAKSPDLTWLSNANELQRLSVEGTYVDGEILSIIKSLRQLVELDLSGCAIDDRALEQISQHPNLETLWLTKTKISEASLETLNTLPKLKACDVGDTAISTTAWRDFIRDHPQIKD